MLRELVVLAALVVQQLGQSIVELEAKLGMLDEDEYNKLFVKRRIYFLVTS